MLFETKFYLYTLVGTKSVYIRKLDAKDVFQANSTYITHFHFLYGIFAEKQLLAFSISRGQRSNSLFVFIS